MKKYYVMLITIVTLFIPVYLDNGVPARSGGFSGARSGGYSGARATMPSYRGSYSGPRVTSSSKIPTLKSCSTLNSYSSTSHFWLMAFLFSSHPHQVVGSAMTNDFGMTGKQTDMLKTYWSIIYDNL